MVGFLLLIGSAHTYLLPEWKLKHGQRLHMGQCQTVAQQMRGQLQWPATLDLDESLKLFNQSVSVLPRLEVTVTK